MKFSNILKINIRKDLSPRIDREIQKFVFLVVDQILKNYGYLKIKIDEFLIILNQLIKSKLNIAMINKDELIFIFENHQNFFSIEKFNGIDILRIKNNFIMEDFYDAHLKKQILRNCKNVFYLYEPVYLKDKVERLTQKVNSLEPVNEIEYLVTNALVNEIQISTKIGDLLTNSKEFIYLLLSYYETDVLYLANLLEEKLKREALLDKNFDFKILYRPREANNKNFILHLKKKLVPLGYTSFYKAFDRKYLKQRNFKRYVGNLHNKSLITDVGILVGSANVTQHSLVHNFESAIYTNNPRVIESAVIIFNQIWEAFENPSIIE